jgi:hypothetical protein
LGELYISLFNTASLLHYLHLILLRHFGSEESF